MSCDCQFCFAGNAAFDMLEKKLCPAGKAAAKKKFKVYPSAYANGWLVREYKKRGGKYKNV